MTVPLLVPAIAHTPRGWISLKVEVPLRFEEALNNGCLGFGDCAAFIKGPSGRCLYMSQARCLNLPMAVGKTFYKPAVEAPLPGVVGTPTVREAA